jgi:dolichyl-phosphate-mannose-protein mannosyltransferase
VKARLGRSNTITVVMAAVAGLVGFATRIPRLSIPRVFVWDEIFYANDALDLLTRGVEQSVAVHPPLGKWLIAGGIELFGFNPLGWRIVELVAGSVTVAITVFAAPLVTRSHRAAALAAVLVLTDGIMFVTGRLALLDGLVALWSIALLVVLVQVVQRCPGGRRRVFLVVASGLVAGAAVATKWSAIPLLFVAVAVVAVTAPHADGRRWLRGVGAGAAVVLVAACTYIASYAGVLARGGSTLLCGSRPCESTVTGRARGFVQLQIRNLEFHTDLERSNRYLGEAWAWPLQEPGVVFFSERCRTTEVRPGSLADGACGTKRGGRARIVARGNRVLWIVASVCVVGATVRLLRRRRALTTEDRALLVTLSCSLAMLLPWLFAGHRSYLYFIAPVVPMLAVTVAAVLLPLRRGALLAIAIGGAATLVFVLQYASLSAIPR